MSFDEPTSMFTLDMDYEEMIEIPDGYAGYRLKDLSNKEVFTGKPQVSGILTSTFTDENEFDDLGNPKEKTVHKIRLVLVNDEEEQYLDININLKKPDYKVDRIVKGSVLFDLVQSILELENEGSTKGKNVFRNVNLKQFTDFIGNLKVMAIQNIERNGTFSFNSFYVVRVNNKQVKIE